jgi:hypothetical protein
MAALWRLPSLLHPVAKPAQQTASTATMPIHLKMSTMTSLSHENTLPTALGARQTSQLPNMRQKPAPAKPVFQDSGSNRRRDECSGATGARQAQAK